MFYFQTISVAPSPMEFQKTLNVTTYLCFREGVRGQNYFKRDEKARHH